jgi:hypothetical protein
MALGHQIRTDDRRRMLIDFANSFGTYPPRGQVPNWWTEFEKYFQEIRRLGDAKSMVLSVRTEAFTHPGTEE